MLFTVSIFFSPFGVLSAFKTLTVCSERNNSFDGFLSFLDRFLHSPHPVPFDSRHVHFAYD